MSATRLNVGDFVGLPGVNGDTMNSTVHVSLGVVDVVAPVIAAGVFILLAGLIVEPARRRFMAVFVGGAGAAYLNGGFGPLEFAYILAATYVAYRGLESYRFIGLAWLMHTAWDVAHHLHGRPIWHEVPSSSFGCAIMDALLALWFFGHWALSVGDRGANVH